jgi:hypothetical protein
MDLLCPPREQDTLTFFYLLPAAVLKGGFSGTKPFVECKRRIPCPMAIIRAEGEYSNKNDRVK